MKTFSVKAILISFGLVAIIDIVLIIKNLTYTLLKSLREAKGSLLMPSSKCIGIADIRSDRLCQQETRSEIQFDFPSVFSLFVYSTS